MLASTDHTSLFAFATHRYVSALLTALTLPVHRFVRALPAVAQLHPLNFLYLSCRWHWPLKVKLVATFSLC